MFSAQDFSCLVHWIHNLPDSQFNIELGCISIAVTRPKADDENIPTTKLEHIYSKVTCAFLLIRNNGKTIIKSENDNIFDI